MGTGYSTAMHGGVWDIVREKPTILAQDVRFDHFNGGWEILEDHQHAIAFTAYSIC